MSYISALKARDDVLVWERNDQNEREMKTYPAPYHFYVKSRDGEYRSIYGDKLKRYDFNTAIEFQQARDNCKSSNIEMFESDIPADLRVLSENYYDVPAPTLNVSFLDIEVDYSKTVGFSSVENPYAPINSVAIFHTHLKKYVVLAIPPNLAACNPTDDEWKVGAADEAFMKELLKEDKISDEYGLHVEFFKNEKDLLIRLLEEIQNSDVVCGWNSDFFDIPYIGKRLEKIGMKYFKELSFPEAPKPKWRTVEIFGNEQSTLDLFGRISADYMVLFRKYEMAERPSYKLESIADEILPDMKKLEYEGTLADLYRDDFAYFVRYNIRDTEILQGFEERLGYVELANQMMHMSTGVFKHVTGTLKLADLATINYCHHVLDNLIVNDVRVEDDDRQIQGAFVLLPQIGLHENVGSVDIASLYPASIRSINISPETLIGQFETPEYEELTNDLKKLVTDSNYDDMERARKKRKSKQVYAAELIARGSDKLIILQTDNGETLEAPACDFRKLLKAKKWAVSGYGTVFDQNKQGIIPMILADWYSKRKIYKGKMNKARSNGDKIKATFYDKLQYVYKIKLNSFYGALTNRYFRFYDLRMGESTTGTGRGILLHQCAQAAKILDGEYLLPNLTAFEFKTIKGEQKLSWHYGYKNSSVIYGDTDSTYFLTHGDDPDQAAIIADRVGELINDSFTPFMQQTFLCNEGFDDIIECEREVISDRGIFVDKKRYILHLTNLDGHPCDKLKVMGLDTKKTTLPAEVSKVLNNYIERLLKGEEWDDIAQDIVEYKNTLEKTDEIMTIGLPKGVKNVEMYTDKYQTEGMGTRLPGHVAAAIFYNICRDKFDDKTSMPIVSNMKIKVFYLTKTYGKFKSIAVPVDIEQIPPWFIKEFSVDKEAHIERLVDKPLQNILKAIDKEVPTKQGLFVDSILDF